MQWQHACVRHSGLAATAFHGQTVPPAPWDSLHAVVAGSDGQNLDPESLLFSLLDDNCRQFRRSNEGEATRVEAEHNPIAPVVR